MSHKFIIVSIWLLTILFHTQHTQQQERGRRMLDGCRSSLPWSSSMLEKCGSSPQPWGAFVACARNGRSKSVVSCSFVICITFCSAPLCFVHVTHGFTPVYIGDCGEIVDAVDPNQEIGFGFVSCSCRACERAGEAKLCGRVREQCFPNACAQNGKMFCGGGGGGSGSAVVFAFLLLCSCFFWLFDLFRCYAHWFFDLFSRLLLCSWVFWCVCTPVSFSLLCSLFFWYFGVFAAMLIVFLMCLYTFLVSSAMPVVFLIFLRFCWYAHDFFNVFVHLSRFRCYVHGLFDTFVFLLVCSLVFWCGCTSFSFPLLCSFFFFKCCVFAGRFMGFLMCLHPLLVLAAMLPS